MTRAILILAAVGFAAVAVADTDRERRELQEDICDGLLVATCGSITTGCRGMPVPQMQLLWGVHARHCQRYKDRYGVWPEKCCERVSASTDAAENRHARRERCKAAYHETGKWLSECGSLQAKITKMIEERAEDARDLRTEIDMVYRYVPEASDEVKQNFLGSLNFACGQYLRLAPKGAPPPDDHCVTDPRDAPSVNPGTTAEVSKVLYVAKIRQYRATGDIDSMESLCQGYYRTDGEWPEDCEGIEKPRYRF